MKPPHNMTEAKAMWIKKYIAENAPKVATMPADQREVIMMLLDLYEYTIWLQKMNMQMAGTPEDKAQ